MLYDYLYELTVVADEKSFSRAAKRLAVSQPALGRHMDALEASLGTRLLVRTPHGTQLTTDGRYLQNRLLDMVAIGDSINDYFMRKASGSAYDRMVYVGGLTTSAGFRDRIEQVLADNTAEEGLVSVRYLGDESFTSIASALEDNLADVVLAYSNTLEKEGLSDQFACFKVTDSPVVVVVETTHPLADRENIHMRELKDYQMGHVFGLSRNGTAEWEECKKCCSINGFFPKSLNMGWEVTPGWGNWNFPHCVLLFCVDTHDVETLASKFGKKVVPVTDASYEVFAVARKDDEVMVQLLERAFGHPISPTY